MHEHNPRIDQQRHCFRARKIVRNSCQPISSWKYSVAALLPPLIRSPLRSASNPRTPKPKAPLVTSTETSIHRPPSPSIDGQRTHRTESAHVTGWAPRTCGADAPRPRPPCAPVPQPPVANGSSPDPRSQAGHTLVYK